MSDNATGRFVRRKEGKDRATLDSIVDEFGPMRSEEITAISMDMCPAFEKSAHKSGHATKVIIC